ncbi:MAG: type I-U CRISPR-associated protein Csb2, partial [bacterium]
MMQSYFCHTVQFLQPYFHGRTDRGEPEWPPSPLRVFQALVAAGATRWREKRFSECAAPALFWLEQQCISSIIAPIGQPADTKYRLYVPDNVADKVGKSWSKGGNDNVANHRTEKDIKPIHLRNGDTVYYTFPLAEDHCPHLEILVEAARSITHLGWGVDMVVGNAAVISEEEVAQLTGERWRILDDDSATGYRVPVKGTLDALIEKHNAFLHRIGPDGSFIPVPPLPTSAFRVVGYRRTTDQAARPFAAFSILKPDASGLRSFDSVRQGLRVAGMLRYAAKQVAAHAGLNESQTNRLVLGHGEAKGEPHLPVGPARFAYFPLPSIEFRGEGRAQAVGRIRRVMVASFAENIGTEFAWVRRSLSGQSLIEEESKNAIAMLSLIPQR